VLKPARSFSIDEPKKGETMFRKTVMAGILASALVPAIGSAADPAPAPTPEHTLTGNVGLFSQYIFRGLTQTNREPALQGGFDYAHSSGFYLGTWGSNISWLRDGGAYRAGGSLELDGYGGYKMTFGDFGVDLGTLYYWYPGDEAFTPAGAAASNVRADTWEAYAGASWKFLSAKFSYGLMDKTFGVRDSRGTWYLDLSANVPLGDYYKPLTGVTLNAHWGYQKYRGTDPRNVSAGGARLSNDDLFSYKDVKLGLSYALPKDFTIGAFYSKAYDANVIGYGATTEIGAGGNTGIYPRNLAKATGTVFIQKTF
jgi:uncharacterized protein (TIGR02001 family)